MEYVDLFPNLQFNWIIDKDIDKLIESIGGRLVA
jgi:hypothetical protein